MKARIKKGFTLVEMLVAMLVMVLIAGAIVVGMRATSNVFWKYDFASGSDMLASTVNLALSDVLRYAEYDGISAENGGLGTVLFTNAEYNISEGIFRISTDGSNMSDAGMLYIVDKNLTATPLVNSGAYDKLLIENFEMKYTDGVFSGSYTITDSYATGSKDIDFAFRTLK